jgi:hypothetical protein
MAVTAAAAHVQCHVPPGAVGELLDGLVQIVRIAAHHDVRDLHNIQQRVIMLLTYCALFAQGRHHFRCDKTHSRTTVT